MNAPLTLDVANSLTDTEPRTQPAHARQAVETFLSHGTRSPREFGGTVNPPVCRASTIVFENMQDMDERQHAIDHDEPGVMWYGRKGTPTTFALQESIAYLEGGYRTLLASSGLSACIAALSAFVKADDHILMSDSVYGPTRHYAKVILARYGIATTFYDPQIGAGIERLIQPNTRVIYVESPGSQTFEVQDIPAIAECAHRHGARVVMDNTWASPVCFRPLEHGVDVSINAATKYISGHSDLAIGTRLSRSSRVVRGPKREFISRCYNLILRGALAAKFSDAQCGFKAIRADVAQALLPLVEDTGWFFDTELLVLAERTGLRIHEVPVDWVDDPDSRVDIIATATADLKGVGRLLRGFANGSIPVNTIAAQLGSSPRSGAPRSLLRQVVRFGTIGVASTLAYLLLFMMMHAPLGAQTANLVALLLTAVVNTAANRRFTFGVSGGGAVSATRHQFEGLIVFGIALAITSGALAGLHVFVPHAHHLVELSVLVAANLLATAVRFVLLRGWVFHPKRAN